jgi:hypothetical protein
MDTNYRIRLQIARKRASTPTRPLTRSRLFGRTLACTHARIVKARGRRARYVWVMRMTDIHMRVLRAWAHLRAWERKHKHVDVYMGMRQYAYVYLDLQPIS